MPRQPYQTVVRWCSAVDDAHRRRGTTPEASSPVTNCWALPSGKEEYFENYRKIYGLFYFKHAVIFPDATVEGKLPIMCLFER